MANVICLVAFTIYSKIQMHVSWNSWYYLAAFLLYQYICLIPSILGSIYRSRMHKMERQNIFWYSKDIRIKPHDSKKFGGKNSYGNAKCARTTFHSFSKTFSFTSEYNACVFYAHSFIFTLCLLCSYIPRCLFFFSGC